MNFEVGGHNSVCNECSLCLSCLKKVNLLIFGRIFASSTADTLFLLIEMYQVSDIVFHLIPFSMALLGWHPVRFSISSCCLVGSYHRPVSPFLLSAPGALYLSPPESFWYLLEECILMTPKIAFPSFHNGFITSKQIIFFVSIILF